MTHIYPRSSWIPSFSLKKVKKVLLYFSLASSLRLSKLVCEVDQRRPGRGDCINTLDGIGAESQRYTYDSERERGVKCALEGESLVIRDTGRNVKLRFLQGVCAELRIHQNESNDHAPRRISGTLENSIANALGSGIYVAL
jgi:hypothetical protein